MAENMNANLTKSHKNISAVCTYDLYRAMAERTIFESNDGQKKCLTITASYDHVIGLRITEEFVQEVLSSKQPAFEIIHNKNGRIRVKRLKLGFYFDALKNQPGFEVVKSILGCYRLSPCLNIYYEALNELGIPFSNAFLICSDGKMEAEHFNMLIDKLRDKSRSAAFRKEQKDRRGQATKNYKSLLKLIERLFQHYARLVVIRVDLAYLTKYKDSITIDVAKSHLKRMLDNRRNNRIFDYLVGYAWRLEWGIENGGYHFHCFFFFDGNYRHADICIANDIGNYWAGFITNGKGRFHNSNMNKFKFEQKGILGIGEIHRDDIELRKNLVEKAAPYLTKMGMFFEIISPDSQQKDFDVFGRSELPPLRLEGKHRPLSSKKLRGMLSKAGAS